jgi:hypothetical protein
MRLLLAQFAWFCLPLAQPPDLTPRTVTLGLDPRVYTMARLWGWGVAVLVGGWVRVRTKFAVWFYLMGPRV